MKRQITHTVQKGESLYSIAKKYNVIPEKLISLNKLKNTLLTVGQVLVVEEDYPIHIGTDICEKEEIIDGKYDLYIVKRGDTLEEIAKNYETTVANILYLNDLHNTLLSLGQQLIVPVKKDNGYIHYIVKEGDTLYSIASNYNITPKQLMEKNQMLNTNLVIGQEIMIPVS